MKNANVKWCDVIESQGELYYYVGVVSPLGEESYFTAEVSTKDRWHNVCLDNLDFGSAAWSEIDSLDADRAYQAGTLIGELEREGEALMNPTRCNLAIRSVARFCEWPHGAEACRKVIVGRCLAPTTDQGGLELCNRYASALRCLQGCDLSPVLDHIVVEAEG